MPAGSDPTVALLSDALRHQTDSIVSEMRDGRADIRAGLAEVRAEARSTRQWGVGLVALGLVLAAAYLGVGADVRIPGGVSISTTAASAAVVEDTGASP